VRRSKAAVVMFPVGPFVVRRYVDDILQLARKKSVGTVCFKTFGAGKLLGDTTGYDQPLKVPTRAGSSVRAAKRNQPNRNCPG